MAQSVRAQAQLSDPEASHQCGRYTSLSPTLAGSSPSVCGNVSLATRGLTCGFPLVSFHHNALCHRTSEVFLGTA